MKINDLNKKLPGLDISAGQARSSKPGGKVETPAASSNNVSISPQSQALASQVAGGEAVFDGAKVQEIQAAIADGSFRINAERVADGLINTVRDLLLSRKN